MNTIKFKYYFEEKEVNQGSYVTLCAGKGKEKESMIYIPKTTFSYIEGLIWDKHREYGNSIKKKISSSDWQRIVRGMITAKDKLDSLQPEELKHLLKFEIFNPVNSIDEIIDDIDALKTFLGDITNWIMSFSNKEKYIVIIKN